jgi:hypothetical protein
MLDVRMPPTGRIGWAALSAGKVRLMVQHRVARPSNCIALVVPHPADRGALPALQGARLEAARATIAGGAPAPEFQYAEDLYSPPYGGRQFSISRGFECFQSD